MQPDTNISELILKHLAGEASPEEGKQLREWRGAKPENEEEYLQTVRIWETSGRITATPSPIDLEAEWQKFRSRHFQEESKVIRLHFKQVIRYAAAAVLLIGILGGAWYFNGYNQYTTGAGQRQLVNLSDGTEILLSQNTTLTVPRTFNWWHRDLKLSGEAFFEVTKNPAKPFTAIGSKTSLRVLGTAFKMVATERINKVEVSEGKVAYWAVDKSDTLILTRQLSGTYEGQKLEKSTIADINFDSWQSGAFNFEQNSLASVLNQLQSYYVFSIKDPQNMLARPCTFTGSFTRQQLDDILSELALVVGLQYEFNDGELILKNLDCQ
ncbi:MAG: hypothetical protein CMI36_08135 [Owenweeksia sp.]|nr:hypothetical protein [Owenweeksia sp.]MBF98946.1 hypothetical protein [Owenweeksia sp.]HBF19915.1 hypothetical protein [Cryomorphaceae bacterium]|tara:strand:- start:346 stop:1320 length:975 start_codon:yes stop_codon:yes gene_type:complete